MKTPSFLTNHLTSLVVVFLRKFIENKYKDVKYLSVLSILSLGPLASHATGQIIYTNSGNNTTGFVMQTFTGGSSSGTFSSNGTALVLSGGTWDTLPVSVTGNFQITYDVYNNSFDGDSHLMLLNAGTTGGVGVTDSPQGTDTPSISIVSATNFTNYTQYYFPTSGETLASATSQDFPNQTLTQIVVTRTGNILTDNVGGQIIQADISGQGLSSTLQIGLGGYATPYDGGVGQLLYSNFSVTEIAPEPSSLGLLGMGLMVIVTSLTSRRLRKYLEVRSVEHTL